jgi:outer membrane immunogenic protein
MRKHSLMLVAAAIGLAASQASAADLPRKAPPPAAPPPPPPITWTGCYIGANIGGIFGRGDAHFDNFEIGSNTRSAFTGGGQIGCDYQFAGGWVIGIRDMFNWANVGRDRTFVDRFGNVVSTDTNGSWFNTLTGRIGYAFAPSWLLYGQGGVAWINHSVDVNINGFDFGEFGRTRTGWTAGGGVEWMFAPGWSAFLEGNYMDFGDHGHTVFDNGGVIINGCGVVGCAFNTHVKAATVLVGVNYRFGWLGKGKARPY